MKIEHIAVWVKDLDASSDFYERFLGGKGGSLYSNPKKAFASRFISFDSGARIELMTRTDKTETPPQNSLGYAHIAFSVGSAREVDRITAYMKEHGVFVESQPRYTGDGYYESVVSDPDGNQVEITE
ncbi:MAG: VOC family protein [Oscillospiraceae bacterium]|jgi:lactoylglutathione lyase|nr:VOC family protein [Oscillospiraceae bacterium]